ncbi:conserved phage C-terminal domain-containing protein [Staphylococcus sp. LKG3-3]|uniref:conserved phage C-terminal domain-containing protein n=1 Tax=Staphylococcus sp. LKG3-3 TaxID=3399685 RepID=UPI003D59F9EF
MSNFDYINDILTTFSGNKRNIVIPKIYLEITGDYPTAALLNQLIFWSDKSKRKDGYFYKKYDEWHDELLLSDYQIRRITKKLEELNFVTTALKKANGTPTKHYKINMNEVQKAIVNKLNNGNLNNLTMDSKETKDSMDSKETKDSMDSKETKESLTDDYTHNYNSENTTGNKVVHKDAQPHIPYKEVIEYLNLKAGKKFNHKAKSNKNFIKARFNEGNTLEDFKHVIDVKVFDWLDDKGMRTYLKPETLFNGKNFEKYKNETTDDVKARKQHWNKAKRNGSQLQGQELLDAMQDPNYWD